MTRHAWRVFLISALCLLIGLPLSLAAVSGSCALAGVRGIDRIHTVMVAGPAVWAVLWFGMLWVAGPRTPRSSDDRSNAGRPADSDPENSRSRGS